MIVFSIELGFSFKQMYVISHVISFILTYVAGQSRHYLTIGN